MKNRLSADISISGNIALDSGVLVEIFSDSELGKRIYRRLVDESISAYTSRVNLAEATYIVCRKMGHEKARKASFDFEGSGYVSVVDEPRLHQSAAETKCERAISLADCYTLAVAELTGSSPLFLRQESDLAREMKKKPFASGPLFLI